MTQISTTPITFRKPDSVSFGELAIAAGFAGKPIAIWFSESTATVDCELWAYFARLVGPARVLHVHSQADVRKLTKAFDHWRLVVVHVPRLYNTVAWTVRSHDSGTSARPAIISRWLMAGCPQGVHLPDGQSTNGFAYHPNLIPVMAPAHASDNCEPTQLRDYKLLAALLCGSCVTRTTQQSDQETSMPTCGQQEYEQVRRLLQSPLL